jgi:hypothetical protein
MQFGAQSGCASRARDSWWFSGRGLEALRARSLTRQEPVRAATSLETHYMVDLVMTS